MVAAFLNALAQKIELGMRDFLAFVVKSFMI
jgi:hypothetical protein